MMHTQTTRVWLKKQDSTRIFLAIPIQHDWQRALSDAQTAVQRIISADYPIRWTADTQYHMTVRFVGRLPNACTERFIDAVRDIASKHAPFVLPFARIVIATRNEPKMVWARFEKTKAFMHLVSDTTKHTKQFLQSECHGMTLVNGHRVVPHVTLARCSGRIGHVKLPIVFNAPLVLTVSSIVVYSSTSGLHGSVYRELGKALLSKQ